MQFAAQQVRSLVNDDPDFFPSYTTAGRWRNSGELWTDWCGGFLAGMMWLFHKRSGEEWWRQRAEHYSQLLEHRKTDRHVHDLGFIFLNTYRHWYNASGNETRMDVVAQAGITLAQRFQEKGQYLASFLGSHSLFIDIMMNVPLLYVAADWLEQRRRPIPFPGLPAVSAENIDATVTELRRIASAHCRTSQKYLVRRDGSTAHEAIFQTTTGEFVNESTQQGLRPDSCWSRGLAWSLYGFGTVYRHTLDEQFLDTARRCANYFLENLPAGKVPYWDFDAPEGQDRFLDSSAASIAASGLLQLAEIEREVERESHHRAQGSPAPFVKGAVSYARYETAALEILHVLCGSEFLASSTPGWEGVLRHAVYHLHKKLGVDESVMWGDHFFVDALVRAIELLEAE
jgi:unsaturated chondroitin disaccharide hydrolase